MVYRTYLSTIKDQIDFFMSIEFYDGTDIFP